MILIILILLFLYFHKENYQNYIDYEDIDKPIYMCPEKYEKKIDYITSLRNNRPQVLLSDLGYSKTNDFNTRVNSVYDVPRASPANFDELFMNTDIAPALYEMYTES